MEAFIKRDWTRTPCAVMLNGLAKAAFLLSRGLLPALPLLYSSVRAVPQSPGPEGI